MTDKRRLEVLVYLPDRCVCLEENIGSNIVCQGENGAPNLVYLTLSTSSIADARKFAKSHFPEAIKISVREL
jgi:hypothetical protein